MRFSTKVLCKKFNQIRKQNWSAPAIMSAFIIACMLCIFSLESLGLLNNSQNINNRIFNQDYNIKIIHEVKVNNKEKLSIISSNKSNNFIINKQTVLLEEPIKSEIFKKKNKKNKKLLLEGALNQLAYELKSNAKNVNNIHNNLNPDYISNLDESNSLIFFDI